MTADVLPIPTPSRSPARAVPRAPERLGLSQLEQGAVTGMLAGTTESVLDYVRDRASAYSSGDPAVRRRALSRAAAVHESQMTQLAALLAAAVARRDPAVLVLDRVLTSATARYRSLLGELRAEFATTRRVIMTARSEVTVTAEEQL